MASSSTTTTTPSSRKKPGADFLCKIRYTNPLPPLPFPPKLLNLKADASGEPSNGNLSRFVPYKHNSLIERTPYPVLPPDADLGMPAEFAALRDAVEVRMKGETPLPIDPRDAILFTKPNEGSGYSANAFAPAISIPGPKAKQAQVSWQRRTEYIGQEGVITTSSQTSRISAREKIVEEGPVDLSREGQIQTIEKSFQAAFTSSALSRLKHPLKPELVPTEVLPVFPDFEIWGNKYTQMVYDAVPGEEEEFAMMDARQLEYKENGRLSEGGNPGENEINPFTLPTAHALVKPMTNPQNPTDAFIAYFAPTPATVDRLSRKRGRDEEDELEQDGGVTDEYIWRRDYTYTSNNSAPLNVLAVVFDTERRGAFWSPIASRLVLRKKRATSKYASAESQRTFNEATEIHLRKRGLTEEEIAQRNEERGVLGLDEE